RGLSRLTAPSASLMFLPSCGQGRVLLRRQGIWMGLRIVERPKSQAKGPIRNDNVVSFAVMRIHGGQAVEIDDKESTLLKPADVVKVKFNDSMNRAAAWLFRASQ